jgi:MFS family permease
MDDLLDGPLSAYTARRLSVVFILSLSWLVAFPMYYSIYDARPFDDDEVALDCSCSSTIANTSRAEHDMCGACGDAGGELACAPHPGLLASSFGFYCDSKAVLALPSSCVITGLLVGGFLGGSLSDRFGRKNTLIGAMATQAFGTLAGAASPYYAAFLTCKVVTGLGLSGVTQAGYTLAAEIVGAKLRTPLSIELWAYMFAVMACLTALIAYLMRDLSWRIQEVRAGHSCWRMPPARYLVVGISPPCTAGGHCHPSCRAVPLDSDDGA